MRDNFEKSVAFVLRREGGYVNDPNDPGGETKYGISKRSYPDIDIKALTEKQAKGIYRRDYWDRAGCSVLVWPMCLVHFDACVNLGISRATEIKAKASGWTDYLFLRLEFYSGLADRRPGSRVYLRGWINRVLDLWREAKDGLA